MRPEPLHQAWLARRPVIVELGLDPADLKEEETWEGEPYQLDPHFEFPRERLHFLVWANNYNCLGGHPRWVLADFAVQKLGAVPGIKADIRLPCGQEVWCDGGPRGLLGDLPTVHRESIALKHLTVSPTLVRPPQDLAPDQARAVLHPSGPARVIAPAGSGKTRVLTSRLAHLLLDRQFEPEIVTALAYNRRAAQEMRDRTADFNPTVHTLHALGYAIVRRRGGADLLAERQVREILGRLVRPPKEFSKDPLAAYIEALGQVRLGLRDPEEVEDGREDIPGFAEAFPKYRRRLRDQEVIDHDEQIYAALECLLTDPAARSLARKGCRHLLVDEFQDLTPAYVLMVRLLCAPSYQVFGVGDDDQVIYGYAGADPTYLIDFYEYFPGAAEYALEVNYRCPPTIIECATHLLERNRRRVRKTIRAAACRAKEPHELEVENLPVAQMTARAVEWVKTRTQPPSQIALLTRVNALLLPLQVALWEARVPTSAPLDPSILERTGIRAALFYLRAANSARIQTLVLLETLKRPSRKIRGASLKTLETQVDWSLADLGRATRRWESWERDALQNYLQDLRKLRGRDTQSAVRFLRHQIGLGGDMDKLDHSRPEGWGSSHLDDLRSLEQLAILHPNPATFEDWLHTALEGSRRGRGGVRLSSIHRVKGMEWDAVVLYAADAKLMPHRLAADKEEERRIFHVAMTRARTNLLIIADQAAPSPFLEELGLPAKKQPEGRRGRKPQTREKRLTAALGQRLTAPGGFTGNVCRLADDHLLLAFSRGGKLRVNYGERVTFEGSSWILRAPKKR